MTDESDDLKETKQSTLNQHRIEVGLLKEAADTAEQALEDEKKSCQRLEERAITAEQSLRKLQESVNTNLFTVVLLDGDGYLFPDDLIRQGTQGGERAAQQLHDAVKGYLEPFEGASRWTVMVRILLNVNGLATTYQRHEVISHVGVLREFAIGFARKEALFDIVDVGWGKERADHKLRGKWLPVYDGDPLPTLRF